MVALAPPPTVRVDVCVPGLAASSQVEVLEGRGLSLAAAAAGGALWLWVCVAAAASFFFMAEPDKSSEGRDTAGWIYRKDPGSGVECESG